MSRAIRPFGSSLTPNTSRDKRIEICLRRGRNPTRNAMELRKSNSYNGRSVPTTLHRCQPNKPALDRNLAHYGTSGCSSSESLRTRCRVNHSNVGLKPTAHYPLTLLLGPRNLTHLWPRVL